MIFSRLYRDGNRCGGSPDSLEVSRKRLRALMVHACCLLVLCITGCATQHHSVYCQNYWCQRQAADAEQIAGVLYWIENDVTNAQDKAMVTAVMREHWKMVEEMNKDVR
jgi:hypothetical protein